MILNLLLLGLLGAIFGSFFAALSYRMVRGISINAGRSFCDKCKNQINWYDNIPIISYFFLSGKCRFCKKRISKRYPMIELFYLFGFILIGFYKTQIFYNLGIIDNLFNFVVLLITFCLLGAVFIVDLEKQIIPDELNYALIAISFLSLLVNSNNQVYLFLLSGFCFSLFLLLINIFTKGKGMGLGDVKFAIFPGLLLGPILGTIWLFLSFILGAIVGVFLIFIGKAKFGRHIPFGPFLVLSLLIVLFFGNIIKDILF